MIDADDPLAPWIGRSEERRDVLGAWPAAALHAALDRAGDPPEDGDPLPPLWRWLYFLPAVRRSDLGRDGHPALGRGFWPPLPPSRRMWAGGRLAFRAPAPLGAPATLVSTIASIARKRGRVGPLTFLTIAHALYLDGDDPEAGPVETEEQDVVYRQDDALAGDALAGDAEIVRPQGPPPPEGGIWRRGWTADPTLLFRYSALTFNGHRIHYDLDYARRVEGYPGLVVHGPLLAKLMLELLREQGPERPLAAFRFRAVGPVFDTEAIEIRGAPAEVETSEGVKPGATLWAQTAGDAGRLAMTGEAVFG